ncbi:hypothetical protein K2F43_18075 [Clostridium estertheticum]|uniref:DUF6773 family protein n=1 Tax=Clostridium estertheticum TaxID=238834 RepID=UPI001C6E700E|nr:DUF6773 family protein [Clostridium estertheticum]MBW9173105.1 hypothetical protein [Clostridium estertheticum]WLC77246.1 hypothetical protein KTC99_10850 [Clostridium estertheticum]
MNKNDKLDEMQIQKRNKIGNNCFMAMFYLLFIDIGLHGFGIRWLSYPMNVLVIITICMGYYLVKTIWAGSYIGVSSENKTSNYTIGMIIASAFMLILGIIITFFFKVRAPIFSNIGTAIIVITLCILVFLAIIAFGNISRHKSDGGED